VPKENALHHRFEVIYISGHSPDHICLYGPEKGWIFTGDAYIGGKDRVLRQDYDIWQISRRLFGREMPIAYFTIGPFTRKNLVRSYTVNRGGINV